METIAENVKHVLNEGCAADKVILQHMDEHIRFTMRQRMMLKRALVERTGEAVPFAFSNDSLGFNEITFGKLQSKSFQEKY
ncbi:hypothetical protein PVAND_009395 [Polypedilum vanderplanki]|uniref:Uncharacterized protein n=1 Tax=Polypedilum vanderplanki TaxID=319348 RepID=A0A9J6CCS0_POLVA|nr:hypothetical protein PVAND_009395 [Polypedilum vanderplanki]